jgi:L-idonate 5-dehydrogenase
MQTMTAAVLHGAGDVRLEAYPRPTLAPGMALVRVRRAGMCGSDLHYFQHGCCGAFVPTRPFVLGHELAGEVAAVADDVAGLAVGARVAINPARACDRCAYCRSGRRNLCRRTIMLGSASTTPPTDGGFAELVAVRADQCHLLGDDMDDGVGAMMEPFAVALHAVRRSRLAGAARVLVTGGGTIGLLVAKTARAFGASLVVASDVSPGRRAVATALEADHAVDPADPALGDVVRELSGDGFDVVFEASGARPALRQAFDLVRPGGTLVQVGTLGTDDMPLPANQLMAREITYLGSFRYADVFDDAIALVRSGRVDVGPLVSRVLPLAQAAEALVLAGNPGSAIKVQLQVTTA